MTPFDPILPLHLTPPTVDGAFLHAMYRSLYNGDDGGYGGDGDNWSFIDLTIRPEEITLTLCDNGQVRDITRLVYQLNGGGDGGVGSDGED